jgi:hypothetical protein
MRFISEIILYHDEDLDSSILRIKICNIGMNQMIYAINAFIFAINQPFIEVKRRPR